MIDLRKRFYSSEIKRKKTKNVIVAGWVQEIRDFGGIKFLVLRDKDGLIQVTAPKKKVSSEIFKKISDISKECVVAVKGEVIKEKQAPGGIEVIPSEIEILSRSESPIPLEFLKIESNLDKRLDWRFLDLRNPKNASIFKIQSVVSNATRSFFYENGFVEIHTPKIIASATEGGANVFPIVYFEKKAFLAQSPQFYKQMMMATGFDKVFEIGPVFRAEPHHTTRHLCEYTSIDFEIAFIQGYEDVMEVVENLFVYILKEVKKKCTNELKLFNRKIEVPKKPFPRITMKEAYELLKREGKRIEYRSDLDPEGERILSDVVKKMYKHEFVFLTEFPWKVAQFYHMRKKDDLEWTYRADLIWNGLEMTTLAQREHRYEILVQQCKEKGLIPEQFNFYLNFFKYGMPPHGGAGTGLERIVLKILGLENIRETTLLPRDPLRLMP
ncbi:MAG: aspartate--tRNA(Asn) ligase [Candidatus Parvarchaeota archaeon]|nr:aspartate--tRNA(Asn) ligase [Candidatus Jingweiarchaeum tengchongense]MCW1297874.1 aspartate--tRNA(Asn) ligase [Candidatus Jingweiarchaeum tengchongense]MCW1299885.1 aspartate--tRNA(Asn) ligase [Candidatus Jingweiarchaeum tengchongense]MCW1305111.1 aspartate--tRNA(Asn) ligase [Candidatus Jingweiarchaeum tengchongense]MCW1305173.1 aspartate--tRNA(Asn) ligase [Candidatus Jingweiarchaeum tengchongense]